MRWYEKLLSKRLSKNFKKGDEIVTIPTKDNLKESIDDYIEKNTPSELLIQLPENIMADVSKLFNISDSYSIKTHPHYITNTLVYSDVHVTFLYATYISIITLQDISEKETK